MNDRTSTIQPTREILLRRLRRGTIPWDFEHHVDIVIFQYQLGHWSFALLDSECHKLLQSTGEIAPGYPAKNWEVVNLRGY